MPRSHSRSRSRSPRPTKSSRSGGGGFRWKEKPRRDEDGASGGYTGDNRGLERGYRDRRGDDGGRRGGGGERGDVGRGREGHRREDDAREDRPMKPRAAAADEDDIASKFGNTHSTSSTSSKPEPTPPSTTSTTSKPTMSKPPPQARPPTGPMIVIKINDRLGTTTKVPCLPSDSIGDLKKLVAMRIGRKPHEIMLKRQGERPFKDFLTLEDYGVGDGVQLDLELDTGD